MVLMLPHSPPRIHRIPGVLSQCRGFLWQVPESQIEQHCKSLLSALRESQNSRYALWVNPNGLFMRVKVICIVDARSESPRVQINVRANEYVLVCNIQ